MFSDYFLISLKNLKNRKLRSWLTIIGIVISVASIIALIALTQGLQLAIEEQFEKVGSNRVFVVSSGTGDPFSAGRSKSLTSKDVDTIEKVVGVDLVTPYLILSSIDLEFHNENSFGTVIAWPSDENKKRFETYDFGIASGRIFKEGEKFSVVLGSKAAENLFAKELRVNNKISISGKKFTVVGIMEEIGNDQDDNSIIIPIDVARDIFSMPDEVSFIDATVKSGLDPDEIAKKIKSRLERTRDDENFEVNTPKDVLEFLNNALSIIQAVLISIAAISLIVGAIGIMNSMYTSVVERTNEIGIMKSIGAKNSDILLLFTIEAGIIGFVGGVFGVMLGYGIAFGVGGAAKQFVGGLLKIKFDIVLMLVGFGFAILVGIVSGFLPARQAAKLKPVDALRYG